MSRLSVEKPAWPKKDVPVITEHAKDRYSELLQIPGMLSIQLQVPDASAEDLRRFPARLSRKDGYLHFPWISAQQSFTENQDAEKPRLSEARQVLDVSVEGCTQETLHTIVMALHLGTVSLTDCNASAILRTADFLQASWLAKVVCDWAREEWLPSDPLSVFQLGLTVPGYGIRDAAIRWMLAFWRTDQVAQVFAMTSEESEAEQCKLLAVIAQIAELEEVLEALVRSAEEGHWELSDAHIHVLIKAFPTVERMLSCILSAEDCPPDPKLVCQKLKIAWLSLSSRMQTDRCWRLQTDTLDNLTDQREVACVNLDSPLTWPAPDGFSFRIRLRFSEGSWGVFVLDTDKRMGSIRSRGARKFVVKCTGRATESKMITFPDNSEDTWGFEGLLSMWLKGSSAQTSVNDHDALYLKLYLL